MSRRRAWRLVAASAAGFAGLATVVAVIGQSSSGSYELWWRTNAGGGSSTGGGYTVQAAIGQPLAGASSGGTFTIASGFFGGGPEKYKRYLPALAKDGVD